jgi:hypothetical protein
MAQRPRDKKSAPQSPQSATSGKPERPAKFVVIRDGHRVSDREYDSAADPACVAEIAFWSKISKSSSHGEKVEAVPYDSKKHRVFVVG